MTPDIAKALGIASEKFRYKSGAFYGSCAGRSLGVGLIYDAVRYPLLNEEAGTFDTVEGPAFVLTHECDVDAANNRMFSEYVLICPIIRFEEWAAELIETTDAATLFQFVPDLAGDNVFRLFYLPPDTSAFPSGGILYFNQICSTHRAYFADKMARPVCALSSYAQTIIDFKLRNHLFRPKSDDLPRLT